jgi:hypothetical protein
LNELAAALGDDANYASTTTTALGNRYTKSETDAKIVALSPPTDISGKFDKTGGTVSGNVNVSGSVKVADDTRLASAAGAGTIRWNDGKLQNSDGTDWTDVNYKILTDVILYRDDIMTGVGGDSGNPWKYGDVPPLNKTTNILVTGTDWVNSAGDTAYYFIPNTTGNYTLDISMYISTLAGDYVGLGLLPESNLNINSVTNNYVTNADGADNTFPGGRVVNAPAVGTKTISGSSTVSLVAGNKYYPAIQSLGPGATVDELYWTFTLIT